MTKQKQKIMESKALKTAIEKAVKETSYQLKGNLNDEKEKTITDSPNTIINTKEFLKLKEEHLEMLELLKDIYDCKDNRFLLEYDEIKELLDRILLNK